MDFEFNPLKWGDEIKTLGRGAWEALPADNFGRVFTTAVEAYDPYREGFWGRFMRNETNMSSAEKNKARNQMLKDTGRGLAESGLLGLTAGVSGGARPVTSWALNKVSPTAGNWLTRMLGTKAGSTASKVLAGGTTAALYANQNVGEQKAKEQAQREAAAWKPEEIVPVGPAPAAPGSAADFRRWEELGKTGVFPGSSQTTRPGPVGPTTITPIEIEPILPAGAPGSTTPAAPEIRPPKLVEPAASGSLSPLTPEQIQALALQERELQSQYDALLNALTLQETQARQAEGAARGAARREAVGSRQDFATQLAAAGLDTSPAPAIAVGQITGSRQQAQEMAAARSLLDILAEAEAKRVGAKAQLAQGKTGVERARIEQQTANTLADQLRLYEQLGGL